MSTYSGLRGESNFDLGAATWDQITLTTAASKIIPGATSLALRNHADTADNIGITDAGVVTIRAGLTVTAGGLVVTAGGLTVTATGITITAGGLTLTDNDITFNGTSKAIIQPVTSLLIRDHANANTNVTITDAGAMTIRAGLTITASGLTITAGGATVTAGNLTMTAGNLVFSAASAKVIPGATSLLFRNNGDSATNLTITDAGAATFRSTVTTTGVLAPTPVTAVTADGAIAVAAANRIYAITKAGVAAMTIVDPTATTHDGVTLTFIATTANAHTLDNSAGSGFFSSGGATKDVATFGGAIGDGLTIIAYQGKWYIDPRGTTNITLG